MSYEDIKSYLEEGHNVFLTGPGGVGKSYYINKLKEDSDFKDRITVTSTTGISSFNLKGQTIHSFSGIGVFNNGDTLSSIIQRMKKFRIYEKTREKLKKCDVLVIDEVSMMGKQFLDILDLLLKKIREVKLPMGGIQVIFTGDFLQLPPINDDYCFKSDVWKTLDLKVVYLTKMYRVNDPDYTDILSRVRMARHTEDDNVKLYLRHIAYKKFIKNQEDEDEKEIKVKPTFLYSRKIDVNEKNMEELDKIQNELLIFKPKVELVEDTEDDKDNVENIKEVINELEEFENKKKKITEEKLYLKVGAQVMLTVNINIDLGLVNGNRGVITSYNSESGSIRVKFLCGEHSITPYEYLYQSKIKYKVYQYPLILAFALSIHKVQGCTLDYAIIDLGYNIFEASMSYVALSRVRNLNGLLLKAYQPAKIFCNKDALDFYNNL